MRKATQPDTERSRVMLELLESVDRDAGGSQRARAQESGVALGLVNAYLSYCVKKGFIRVRKIPAKRYMYYLTPKGFAEKSRLALTLVSNSFRSFRQAREDYCAAFHALKARGLKRVVLVGMSELAEISTLCAAEAGVTLVAIIDHARAGAMFGALPIVARLDDVKAGFDAAVICDLGAPQKSYDVTVAALGASHVLAPAILGTQSVSDGAAA